MFDYDITEKVLVGYKRETYIGYDIRSSLLEKFFKSLEKFFTDLSYRVYKLNKLVNRIEVERHKEVPIYAYDKIDKSEYDWKWLV